MKKIKVLFVALSAMTSLVALSSCGGDSKQAEDVAKDFLSSYFATDYQAAASCCTEELSEALLDAVEEYYSFEENVRKDVVDISSSVVTTITSIKVQSKDSILVKYDMVLPDSDRPIENVLTIVQVEGDWRVAKF